MGAVLGQERSKGGQRNVYFAISMQDNSHLRQALPVSNSAKVF